MGTSPLRQLRQDLPWPALIPPLIIRLNGELCEQLSYPGCPTVRPSIRPSTHQQLYIQCVYMYRNDCVHHARNRMEKDENIFFLHITWFLCCYCTNQSTSSHFLSRRAFKLCISACYWKCRHSYKMSVARFVLLSHILKKETNAKEGESAQPSHRNIYFVKCYSQTPSIWKRASLKLTVGNTVFWGTIRTNVHLSSLFLFGLKREKV